MVELAAAKPIQRAGPCPNNAAKGGTRNVSAMPSGYLVDRKGVVRYVHRGFNEETAALLDKQVEALLKE